LEADVRYMMLMCSRETLEGPPAEEVECVIRTHRKIVDDARRKGVLVAVEGLEPTSTAKTIRSGPGANSIVLDGPFTETKEVIAGYYVLDCRDLDHAIEWAKRIPTSCKDQSGCIEIRPVSELRQRLLYEPYPFVHDSRME
jgi:hypothetical protein